MSARDLVVFGATGTTGGEVVRYLASRANHGLRWAIAGRDRSKLECVRSRHAAKCDVLVVDLTDEARVPEIVSETRVVLNTAGPFALLAEPLIRACARGGVDYVDVSGETAHVRRMIDRYHDDAVRSGARIVPCCGFDAVPSDLGVLLLVEHFRQRGSATQWVKGFMRATGFASPGSFASTRALLSRPDDFHAMRDPELLSPNERRDRVVPADPTLPVFDPHLKAWVGPSPMGPINTRVVRRSAALLRDASSYGADFQYSEFWDPGGPFALATAGAAAWGNAAYQFLGSSANGAQLLASFGQMLETGPRRDTRDAGHFRARFVGMDARGATAWSEVAGFGDPPTDVTATLVTEAALALLAERERLPGGILTPASALGPVLVDRLRAAGMSLRILDCPA